MKSLKYYKLKSKDKLIFSGEKIREFKRIILKEVLVKFSNWFGKLQKNKQNENKTTNSRTNK